MGANGRRKCPPQEGTLPTRTWSDQGPTASLRPRPLRHLCPERRHGDGRSYRDTPALPLPALPRADQNQSLTVTTTEGGTASFHGACGRVGLPEPCRGSNSSEPRDRTTFVPGCFLPLPWPPGSLENTPSANNSNGDPVSGRLQGTCRPSAASHGVWSRASKRDHRRAQSESNGRGQRIVAATPGPCGGGRQPAVTEAGEEFQG